MTKSKSSTSTGHEGVTVVPTNHPEVTWIGTNAEFSAYSAGRPVVLGSIENRPMEVFGPIGSGGYLGMKRLGYDDVVPSTADRDQVNRFEAPIISRGDVRMVLDDDDFAAVQKVFVEISNKNRKRIERINRSAAHPHEQNQVLSMPDIASGVGLVVPLRDISALFLLVFVGLSASSVLGGKNYIHPIAGVVSIIFLSSLIAMDFVYKRNKLARGI